VASFGQGQNKTTSGGRLDHVHRPQYDPRDYPGQAGGGAGIDAWREPAYPLERVTSREAALAADEVSAI
jgi:hypothetical protein